MKKYTYYAKVDSTKESLDCVVETSRLTAAKYFAKKKQLELKKFLTIYNIPK